MEQLHKMKLNDSHTLLIFIKFYVADLQKKVSEEMVILKEHIAGISQWHDKIGEELSLVRGMALQNSVSNGSVRQISPLPEAQPDKAEAGSFVEAVLPEPEALTESDLKKGFEDP